MIRRPNGTSTSSTKSNKIKVKSDEEDDDDDDNFSDDQQQAAEPRRSSRSTDPLQLSQLRADVIDRLQEYESKAKNQAMRLVRALPSRIDFIDMVLEHNFPFKPYQISETEQAFARQLDADGGYWARNQIIGDAIPIFRDVLSQFLHELSTLETWILLFRNRGIKRGVVGPLYEAQMDLLDYLRNHCRPFCIQHLESIKEYYEARKEAISGCGYRYSKVYNETIHVTAETCRNSMDDDNQRKSLLAEAEAPLSDMMITGIIDVDDFMRSRRRSTTSSDPSSPQSNKNRTGSNRQLQAKIQKDKTIERGSVTPLEWPDGVQAMLAVDVMMYTHMMNAFTRCNVMYKTILQTATRLHRVMQSNEIHVSNVCFCFRFLFNNSLIR